VADLILIRSYCKWSISSLWWHVCTVVLLKTNGSQKVSAVEISARPDSMIINTFFCTLILKFIDLRIFRLIMSSVYEEVEIEDLDFDPKEQVYTYTCPCGDKFRISLVSEAYQLN